MSNVIWRLKHFVNWDWPPWLYFVQFFNKISVGSTVKHGMLTITIKAISFLHLNPTTIRLRRLKFVWNLCLAISSGIPIWQIDSHFTNSPKNKYYKRIQITIVQLKQLKIDQLSEVKMQNSLNNFRQNYFQMK